MKKLSQNEKGQSILEAVLLIAVFFGISALVSNAFKDENLLAKINQGPWEHVAGMMENGVWEPVDQSKSKHPNLLNRHGSPEGEVL